MALPVVNPRAVAGLPTPHNSDGSPRPMLAPNLSVMTVHYTGTLHQYAGDDTGALMRLLNTIYADVKPFEYNWVVDQQGAIWEYAGDYQAAHSAGENSTAIGVLSLVGVGEIPTDGLIVGLQYLRANLILRGRLTAACRTVPHHDMPGAATACPGALIDVRFGDILKPFEFDPPPPPPSEDDMPAPLVGKWKGANAWFITDLFHGYRYVSSVDEAKTAVLLGEARWGDPTKPGVPLELDKAVFPNLPEIKVG